MKNYIKTFSLLLIAVSMIALTNCKGAKMDKAGKALGIESFYELIYQGSNSNNEEREVIVVQSQDKLEELFAQINSTRRPGLEIPKVDFKTETVVFAYAGQKSTGGYHVDLTHVDDKEDQTHFKFEIKRAPGDMATMSITTAFKIIKVKSKDKKITASF